MILLRINEKHKTYDKIFFSDDTIPNNRRVYKSRNYSLSTILRDFDLEKVFFVIANGDPNNRKKISNRLNEFGVRFATLIDPAAIISSSAKIGKGTIVCQFSSISSSVKIQSNCLQ